MNLTYIHIELARLFRDVTNWMFIFGMPVLMYLLFGTGDTGHYELGRATVGFYIMASVAAYGAVVAATGVAAQAASEAMLGWGRQLGLTRQPAIGFVLNKVAVALIMATAASGLVFAVGAATGVKVQHWWVWPVTWAIAIVGSALFGVFGLAMALLLKSESAVGIASGAAVFLAFFGNVFMPLSGGMLTIAKFTPMYGYVGLVRFPQVEGQIPQVEPATYDSIWLLVGNYVVWLVIFVGLGLLGAKRSRVRR